MCFYIFVAIPSSTVAGARATLPRGLSLIQGVSPSLPALEGDDRRVFAVVEFECSCRLFGSDHDLEGDEFERRETMKRKYRKKQWSEAKIRRALGQSSIDRTRAEDSPGLRQDVRLWIADFADAGGPIAVLVQWITGPFESHKWVVDRREQVTADQWRKLVAQPRANELYWVRGGE